MSAGASAAGFISSSTAAVACGRLWVFIGMWQVVGLHWLAEVCCGCHV